MNYLASPPLCVAYALAGTMDIDLYDQPLGEDRHGEPVFLKDIWPTAAEVAATVEEAVQSDMFRKSYGEVFDGDERWNALEVPDGRAVRVGRALDVRPPAAVLRGPAARARADRTTSSGARVLAVLGDSVTTDHISPAGSIKRDSPAAGYLDEHRRGAAGLQLLRLAPRQPRGHDARHVRQHPPAQRARAGHRGRRDDLPGPTVGSSCRSTTRR